LKPFFALPLVATDSFIGLSSMMKILSGGGQDAILTTENLGTGDMRVRMNMTLQLSLIVQIGYPLD